MTDHDTDGPQPIAMSEIADGMGFTFDQNAAIYIMLYKTWYNNGNCVCFYVMANGHFPQMSTGDHEVYPA